MLVNLIAKKFFRAFSTESKVILPDLKYKYSDLQPVISSKLLETHHKKHHQTYINNLNNALEQFTEAQENFEYNKMATLSKAIQFNLGGHINHSIYWQNLAPIGNGGGQYPAQESSFSKQIVQQFGSYGNLEDEMTKKTIPIMGSGWGWLGYDHLSRSLRILQMPNQEMIAPAGLTPLLTIDVWQHAYYIDYKNVRMEYVKQIWKIINWKDVERRFITAIAKK